MKYCHDEFKFFPGIALVLVVPVRFHGLNKKNFLIENVN